MTYLLDETASSTDTRASSILRNGNIEWRIELKGYLFYPTNLGAAHSRPVLVYNHGHDSTEPPCAVVKYFRDKGFIVFAPLRRGQGEPSNPDHSTGINIETYTQNCPTCITQAQFDIRELNYVKTQSRDIATAVDWIGNRQHADPKKISLMGHSYGGIAVIFANELAPNPPHHHKAVLDVCRAELSWESNSVMRLELPPAVTRGRRPIFFLQAENGPSVGPTLAFMPAAASVGLDYWAHIYPPVPNVDRERGPRQVHPRGQPGGQVGPGRPFVPRARGALGKHCTAVQCFWTRQNFHTSEVVKVVSSSSRSTSTDPISSLGRKRAMRSSAGWLS